MPEEGSVAQTFQNRIPGGMLGMVAQVGFPIVWVGGQLASSWSGADHSSHLAMFDSSKPQQVLAGHDSSKPKQAVGHVDRPMQHAPKQQAVLANRHQQAMLASDHGMQQDSCQP